MTRKASIEGAAELIALSEEPSGQYEGSLIGSTVVEESADDGDGSEVEVSYLAAPYNA